MKKFKLTKEERIESIQEAMEYKEGLENCVLPLEEIKYLISGGVHVILCYKIICEN